VNKTAAAADIAIKLHFASCLFTYNYMQLLVVRAQTKTSYSLLNKLT